MGDCVPVEMIRAAMVTISYHRGPDLICKPNWRESSEHWTIGIWILRLFTNPKI